MTRISKLAPFDKESAIILKDLQEQAKAHNDQAKFDENGNKTTLHVVKMYNSKGSPYFLLQKRQYTQRISDKKKLISDPETVKKIKEAYSNKESISSISRKFQISPFLIKKIIA
jgi:uncharacterized protein YgiM (DUF1202 family)